MDWERGLGAHTGMQLANETWGMDLALLQVERVDIEASWGTRQDKLASLQKERPGIVPSGEGSVNHAEVAWREVGLVKSRDSVMYAYGR